MNVSNATWGECYHMSNINTSKTYKDRAKAAAGKAAALGEDIDLSNYASEDEEHPFQKDPSQLPTKAKEQMLNAGVMLDDASQRSGTYIQMDNTPVHHSISQEGVEVMAVSQALEKYDWLADYWWQAVAVDADKYTANIELSQNDGYFIRALPGQKTGLCPARKLFFRFRPACTWPKRNLCKTCIISSSLRKTRNCTLLPAVPLPPEKSPDFT